MIDLHLHSTYSDGTFSPAELVDKAVSAGLLAISITDHDTAAGTGEALAAGRRCGLRVVPGIELSVVLDDMHFHLLGYNFNWQDQGLATALKELQDGRRARNSKIIARLQDMGLAVSEDELQAISEQGQAGRPHIARLLVQKNIVKSISQAFTLYLKKGRCCYVPRFLYHAAEAIELLHDCGGSAVLAHPVQMDYSVDRLDALLGRLKKMGLDGIETYYPTQKGKFHKSLRSLAHAHQLFETGGSDYHGDIRPGTSLAGHRRHRVPAELLEQMDRHFQSTQYDTITP